MPKKITTFGNFLPLFEVGTRLINLYLTDGKSLFFFCLCVNKVYVIDLNHYTTTERL